MQTVLLPMPQKKDLRTFGLFDFKRIEWLDVDEMLKYVELEYNKERSFL